MTVAERMLLGARAKLRLFEKAVRAHEFMGAMPKDEWPGIETEYRARVAEMRDLLQKLVAQACK